MQENSQAEDKELADAIDREQTRRSLSFSATLLPIGGVWVNQFTPAAWVNLGLVGSPFLGGDRGTPYSTVSVLEFLWIVSPEYRAGSFWRQLFFFIRNYRACQPATATAIFDYLDAAFQDTPPHQVGGAGARRSYWAGLTTINDFFAREYGWDDAATMSKPLARLFQYFNYDRSIKDPQAPQFNPSDKVRGKLFHLRNARNG